MAETTSSQSQHTSAPKSPFQLPNFPLVGFQIPAFDPASFGFGPVAEAWQKAAADHQARVAAMFDEYAKAEEKSVAEARRAVEELSRLTLASLDYARDLSAQARKAALEMSKKAVETAHADAKKA